MRPRRVQLRRVAGWRKPQGAVVVARPTRWGNPYVIGPARSRADAVALFEQAIRSSDSALGFTAEDVRRELVGRDLACWCPLDEPCHADVLLRLANDTTPMS
jgi:hypothetical protein